jgi:hypothetical protein
MAVLYLLWPFCIYYGRFVFIMAVLYLLWSFGMYLLSSFGIYYGHLFHLLVIPMVYFSPFWYLVPRQIWQPCLGSDTYWIPRAKKELLFSLSWTHILPVGSHRHHGTYLRDATPCVVQILDMLHIRVSSMYVVQEIMDDFCLRIGIFCM